MFVGQAQGAAPPHFAYLETPALPRGAVDRLGSGAALWADMAMVSVLVCGLVMMRVVIRRGLPGCVVRSRWITEIEHLGQDSEQQYEYAADPDRPAPAPGR